MIPTEKHIQFFSWQKQLQEDEWKKYATSSMEALWKSDLLFVGRIWGYDETRGNLVLRFKSENIPRIEQPYLLCLVGERAGVKPEDWHFSYLQFRSSNEFSSINTEVIPGFFLRSKNKKWSYVATKGAALKFVNSIRESFLKKKIHPIIVLAKTDPPIRYLLNLIRFLQQNPNIEFFRDNFRTRFEHWTPINIDNSQDISQSFIGFLSENDVLSIQGPPGTGKSFLVAQLCDFYQDLGYSVCVSALTNKALLEVAEKEPLRSHIMDGNVFKTNLSSDEIKKVPELLPVEEILPGKGQLLLCTYYKMSDHVIDFLNRDIKFDLIIVEEASQAFLATIVALKTVTTKVIVVGDHKQLAPIVLEEDRAIKIHPDIRYIIRGFETFSSQLDNGVFRLTKTRRLSTASARLTGIFYDNILQSIAEPLNTKAFKSSYDSIFEPNGGVSLVKLPLANPLTAQRQVLQKIVKIAIDLLELNSDLRVALLSPYINKEKSLYGLFSSYSDDDHRITIRTIHRIQGMTTDIVILFLPLDNPGFDVNDQLFNVATSRAKKGTLIVTYSNIDLLANISNEVKLFLSRSVDVTVFFMDLFNKE